MSLFLNTLRLLSIAGSLALLSASAVAQTPTLDSEQSAFLTLINNYRAQNGLAPLRVSVTLQNSSQWMSADMAAKNYFSHTDSLGRDPFTRMTSFGYTHYPEGENIAAGYSDAQHALNQWINACDPDSTGTCTYAHRKNMLSAGYTAIGIGRAYGASSTYRWYWTTDFGGFVDQPLQTGTPPPNAAPTADSVSPNTGTGAAQTFRLIYSDPNGYTDLSSLNVLISPNGGSANSCYIHYTPSNNTLYLSNDAGTAWLAGIVPGTSASSSNAQCTVTGSGSSAYGSGNSITVNLALSFKSGYAGTKTIYMLAQDKSGADSSWQSRGTWTVPAGANTAPTVVSATPNSGTVSAATFRFATSDANGYADMPNMRVLVNSTLNGANACYVFYNRAGNSVSLLNDAATAWLGPVALGSSASVHNSACVISGAGSSAAGSGNTLTLNLNMSFYHAFTGTKNIYMYAQDNAGAVSGWQARGTVFVP